MRSDAHTSFNLNVTVTDGGFFNAGGSVNWSLKNDRAPSSKFYFITEGKCEITVEGKTYTASAGDWFFIPARVEHSYHNFPGVPFKKYWMHFDLYPRKNIVKLFGADYLLHSYDSERATALFRRFVSLYGSGNFADGLLVKAITLELLSIFMSSCDSNDFAAIEESPFNMPNVFSYIENNMSMKISINTLAAISHMHPTHFIRYFKKETGQTPGEYISQRKMERAKYLLESTELQICEISEQLGFYDAMHFSKVFKKRYSVTPTTYRKIYSK